jgi:hypothetical protein
VSLAGHDNRKARASTYIQDNEEDHINAVQQDKNGKQPPSGISREQKGEASTRVIQEKP